MQQFASIFKFVCLFVYMFIRKSFNESPLRISNIETKQLVLYNTLVDSTVDNTITID